MLKAYRFIFSRVAMAMAHTCTSAFLSTEVSKFLEKKVDETQVSKTVFSRLN